MERVFAEAFVAQLSEAEVSRNVEAAFETAAALRQFGPRAAGICAQHMHMARQSLPFMERRDRSADGVGPVLRDTFSQLACID